MTTITEQLASALAATLSVLEEDHSPDRFTESRCEGCDAVTTARKALSDYYEITAKDNRVHGIPGGREWRAYLTNEKGMVSVIGTRAAVLRCIELGRFEPKA